MLDGAWWPRSHDPVRELAPLIGALTAQVGTVFRIGLNRANWNSYPRRVIVGGRVIKLGWYGPRDVHAISVSGAYPHHLDLLVVPPEAAPASAKAAMVTASDATSHARASDVLTANGISIDFAAGPADSALGAPAGPEQTETDTRAVVRPRRTAPVRTTAVKHASGTNGTRRPLPPANAAAEGQQS